MQTKIRNVIYRLAASTTLLFASSSLPVNSQTASNPTYSSFSNSGAATTPTFNTFNNSTSGYHIPIDAQTATASIPHESNIATRAVVVPMTQSASAPAVIPVNTLNLPPAGTNVSTITQPAYTAQIITQVVSESGRVQYVTTHAQQHDLNGQVGLNSATALNNTTNTQQTTTSVQAPSQPSQFSSWGANSQNSTHTSSSRAFFLQMHAGTTTNDVVPMTTTQALQQMNDVLNYDFASWTGSINNYLTISQVGQLLANPNITGSQAAVLGMIADLMYIDISNSGNPDYAPSYSLSQMKSFTSNNPGYYTTVMSQIASAKNGDGSYNLYGIYQSPQLSTIKQGAVGDCYLMSAIEAVLNQNPTQISNMITHNNNGSFTVTFPNNGPKHTFALTDGEIAQFSFALNNGAWLSVMGMAESKELRANPPFQYSWAEQATPLGVVVNGGYPTQTLSLLTGQSYTEFGSYSPQLYNVNFVNKLLTQNFTNKTPMNIVSINHALSITNWNAPTQTVTILNPWGTSGTYQPEWFLPATVQMTNGYFNLTTSQMLSYFMGIDVSTSLLNQVSTANGVHGQAAISMPSPVFNNTIGSTIVNVTQAIVSPPVSAGLPIINNLPNLPNISNIWNSSSLQAISTNIAQSNMISSQLTTYQPGLNPDIKASLLANAGNERFSPLDRHDGTINVSLTSPAMPDSHRMGLKTADLIEPVKTEKQSEILPQLHCDVDQIGTSFRSEVAEKAWQGSLLVLHDRPIHVHAHRALVHVAPHAAALVVQIGKEVAIHNLADNHRGDVSIEIKGKQITVPMGKAILLTDDLFANPSSVPLASCLYMQDASSLGKYGDSTAVLAKISYRHVLRSCPQLRQFMHSPDPTEHKIATKFLKSCAAIYTMTGRL